MAQKIKKKFLDQELIDQIDLIESDLAQELLDRAQGDIDALQDAKDYADQKIADLIGTAPEILDTLGEIATALQDEQTATGSILSQLANHETRIEALENSKDIYEFENLASFPSEGQVAKIYVAKDSNKIYRYQDGEGGEVLLPEMPAAPELTPTTSITSADNLQATIDAASNGDVIFLANGTYSIAANLTISKEIALIGESQEGVLIQDTRGNAQSFVSVSANNVTLKDLTVRHVTTDSNIGHAIVVSGGGFPQARLDNFRMYNVKSQYSKGGLSIRSDNFVVEGCTFEIAGGSSTRRGILHYGNGGDSFIKDCVFINNVGATLRAICPTSTSGSNPSDNQSGSLTIDGSTFIGTLSQFVNMDNHQGLAGDFELIVINNVTPESNAFVVSFGAAANFGDLFSRIVLMDNNLTNNHSSGLGKGVLALDAFGGLFNYRSSALPVVATGNVLGQLDFRDGYAEATGSTGSIVGYNTTQLNQPNVEVSEGAGSSGEYVELSPTIDQDLSGIENRLDALEGKVDQPAYAKVKVMVGEELAYIDLEHEAVVSSLVVSVGRVMVHEGDDFETSVVDSKTRLTWINSLANPDGEEKIETGDVVYATYAYLA